MRKKSLIFVLAGFLLLAANALANPLLNEVVFDPLGGDDQWVEIYNNSGAAVVMTDFVLTNQGAFSYTFPAFTLGAGAFVVVHVGLGADTATELFADQAANPWSVGGDDLLLLNDLGTGISYIAWGGGPDINPCPPPLSWANDIDISAFGVGDSAANYPNGATEADGDFWIRRTGGQVSKGSGNGQQPAPTVSFVSVAPVPGSACQTMQADIRITNNDSLASLYDTQLVATIPADYYFDSSDPAGVYNAVAHTITWSIGEIAADGVLDFELVIKPACAAATGSELLAQAHFRRFPSEPDPRNTSVQASSGAIALNNPVLEVELGEFTTGQSVIWKEIDQTVEYKMTVRNTGIGSTGTGVPVSFTYGAGLTLVTIKNDSAVGSAVIYTEAGNVASWVTDPIAAGNEEVFYIRATTTACADLAATAALNWGCADSGGAPSCSLADSALAMVRCPLTFTLAETLPEGGGTFANVCQEFIETLTLVNNDENQLDLIAAVVSIPDDYYFVSSNPAGVYDAVANTVTFAVGSMAGNSSQALEMVLKGSCNAISMQRISALVSYEDPVQTENIPVGDHIVLKRPDINISLEDENNLGATTILAARGDTVVFRLNVANTGNGALKEGADLEFEAGTGFTDIVFYDSANNPLVPQPLPVAGVYSWNSGEVPAASTVHYKIELKVSDCENLTNQAYYTWGCADFGGAPSCSETGLSNSSITILLKTPLLSVAVPAISVDWCAGTTVSIPVTNNGTGPARKVVVHFTGFNTTHLDIVTTAASHFSYVQNGAVAEFNLTDGDDTDADGVDDDIAAGNTKNIVFTYSVKPGGAGCPAGGASGGLVVQPYYLDDCDNIFTAGSTLGSYSVGARPRVSISKSGPAFVSVGQTGFSWSFTVSNNYINDLDVEVVDNYPDASDTPNGWGNFVCTNTDGGTDNGNTVSFTGANAITVPAGGSVTKTLVFDAPTETCAGGQTYNNTAILSISETDCNGCEILGNNSASASSVFVNNTSEVVINSQTRTISYTNFNSNGRQVVAGQGETCAVTEDGSGNIIINGGVNFNATIDFNNDPSVPATWDDTDGNGNNIRFTENLDGGLGIPGPVGDPLKTRLNLAVDYNGNDISGDVVVTDNTGSFTIDFGNVDEVADGAPQDGGLLSISYTLHAPDSAAGSFISTHTLRIPHPGAECDSALPQDYDWGAVAGISASGASVGVSKRTGASTTIDRCETATFRINAGTGNPWTVYDTRIELDLAAAGGASQYVWNSGSTVTFSGFTDENDVAIAAFDPTEVGNILRWDFGDLNSLGYIEVELEKRCSIPSSLLRATIYSNTNCNNVVDGTGYGSNSSTGTWSAVLLRTANMEVVLTPETYFIKDGYPVMRFYVLNSGNGVLYNAEVPLVFGDDLAYYSHTETLPVGTSMGVNFVDPQNTIFTFDKLEPGAQAFVEFTMKTVGCANKTVEIIDATWGCAGETAACQASLPLSESADIRLAESRIIVTEHSAEPPFLDYCGSVATFTIRINNSSITEVYEIIARETLPPGLALFDTPRYRIDQNGDGVWDGAFANFPGGYSSYDPINRVITWNFMDPDWDGDESDSLITTTDGREMDPDGLRHRVLKPGARIEVQFGVTIDDCAAANAYFAGSRTAVAEVLFDTPCDHTNASGMPLSSSFLNTVTSLPSDANVDVFSSARNPSGAPWNGAWVTSIVRGQNGQTIEWKVRLINNGFGYAPDVNLEKILPGNVTYSGWVNAPAESTAGISMDFVSGDGTAGDPLLLVVNNSNLVNNPLTPFDETTYLDRGQFVTIIVSGVVNSCSPAPLTDISTVTWGCCTLTGPPGSYGSNVAAVDLRTNPDGELATNIAEAPGNSFDGCSGALQITLSNPNADFSLYGLDLTLPIPAGFAYDNSTADQGTVFNYAGNAGRAAITLTQAEEEPQVVGNTLLWRNSTSGGSIADAKAIILPGETITINVYFNRDGLGCGLPAAPFSAQVDSSVDDSCGNQLFLESPSVAVSPEQALANITALAPDTTLAKGGDTVSWTFTLANPGGVVADNLTFALTLGDGYQNMTRVSGVAEDSLVGNVATWNRGTVNLAAADSLTWVYEAQVLAGGGDLRAILSVDGYCVDLNGDDVCQYADNDQTAYLPGAEVIKTISSVNTPAAITNAPDNTTANATHGNAITYSMEVRFTDDGPYSSVAFTDTLPANMTFVSAVPAPDSVAGQVLTWNLAGGTGIVNNAQSFSIDVVARVANAAARGSVLTNTADLSFVHQGTAYNSSTHPANLSKTNSVTVIAPRFRAIDCSKTSVPAGAPAPGSLVEGTDTIDFTFVGRNSGTSPSYETAFLDTLPIGMRAAAPINIAVGVDETDDSTPERNLLAGVDYNSAWNGATGAFSITLLSTADAIIALGEALVVNYRATVDASVGVNVTLLNSARINAYSSLPGAGAANEVDRVYAASGPVNTSHYTAGPIAVAKTVANSVSPLAGQGTIGELLTYTLSFVVPENSAAFDLAVLDVFPDGLTVLSAGYSYENPAGGAPITGALAITPNPDGTFTVSGIIGDVVANAVTGDNTVTLAVTATIDQKYFDGTNVVRGIVFDNTGTFIWNGIDDTPASEQTASTGAAPSITVIEPTLANLAKSIVGISSARGTDSFYWYDGVDPDPITAVGIPVVLPGDVVTYRVSVENTDGDCPAYGVMLVDNIPSGMSYNSLVSVTGSSRGVLGPGDYTINSTAPNLQITVDLLEPGETLTVDYSLSVQSGVAVSRVLINSARITDYSTLPAGNPHEALERDTSSDPAYAALGPVTAMLGVQNTSATLSVYRIFDELGNAIAPQSVSGSEVRLGEILRYEVEATLWNNTAFLKGGPGEEHFIFRVALPQGVSRVAGQDILDEGSLSAPLVLLGASNVGAAAQETWHWRFDSITNGDGADKTVRLVFFAAVTNDFNHYDDNTLSYSLVSSARVVWDTTDTGIELGDAGDSDRPRLDPANISCTLTQPSILTNVWQSVDPVCGSIVTGGQAIDFTVRAHNTGSAGAVVSTAYNLVFVANVPEELRDVPGPQIQAIEANGAPLASGVDYSTSWDVGTGVFTVSLLTTANASLLRGQHFEITYRCLVDGAVGTDTDFTSQAVVESYTSYPGTAPAPWPDKKRAYGFVAGLGNPSYLAPLACIHSTASPLPTKAVTMRQTAPAIDPVEVSDNSGRATIGERVTFRARLVVPENLTIYDLKFEDIVADGLSVHAAGYSYMDVANNPVTGALNIVGNANGTTTVSGDIGDVTANAVTGNNTILVFITCTVNKVFSNSPPVGAVDTNSNSRVDRGDRISNLGSFIWNRKNGDDSTSLARNTNNNTAIFFDIVEPVLASLAKGFSSAGGDLYDSDGTTPRNRGTATYYHYTAGPTLNTVTGVDTVWSQDFLRFTVTMANTGTSAAHEINMVDTLPAELSYAGAVLGVTGPITATASDGSLPAITVNGTTPNLDVTFSPLNAGATLTIVYWCQVNQGVGAGRYLQNSVSIVDYSSLNDTLTDPAPVPSIADRERSTDAGAPADPGVYPELGPVTEQAGVANPAITKNQYRLYDEHGDLLAVPVNINAAAQRRVRVGEIIRYEIVVTLRRYTTLFDGNQADPQLIFRDVLPAGLLRVPGTDTYNTGDIPITVVSVADNGPAASETWFWRCNDIANNTAGNQTAILSFDAYVSQVQKNGNPIFTDNSVQVARNNNARIYWDTQETDPIERGTGNNDDRPWLQSTRRVDVQQPRLSVSKVSDQPPATPISAGDDVEYTVNITNQNAATFTFGLAYDLEFVDTLPVGMRNAAPLILSVTAGGRPLLAGRDYTTGYNTGMGLFWVNTQYDAVGSDYDARLAGQESLIITYRAWVDATVGTDTLVNEALVNQYWSLPAAQPTHGTGRKSYGPLGPAWVVLQTEASEIVKTSVPASGAYVAVGDNITYSLVLPNPAIAATMYDVEIVDILPDGLEIVDPAADIIAVGGTGTAIAWAGARNEQVTVTTDSIAPGDQVSITITARVTPTFLAGGLIGFYHAFENFGTSYYYNLPAAPRTRYSAVSNRVSHYFRPTGILLEPDHTESGAPGTVKIYRHILRNLATAADNITLTYGPSTQAWEWMLYPADGSGNITGAPIFSGNTVAVPAGATQELVLKAFIPQNTPAHTQDVVVLTATGATNTVFVTDITLVQEGRVAIIKDVSTDGANYVTEAGVEPKAQVYQRLTVFVSGDEAVMSVYIMDAVPANTVYVRNSATDENAVPPAINDPDLRVSHSTDGGVTWTVGEPATDAIANNVTNLRWQYIGNPPGNILEPGYTKQVVFRVQIK